VATGGDPVQATWARRPCEVTSPEPRTSHSTPLGLWLPKARQSARSPYWSSVPDTFFGNRQGLVRGFNPRRTLQACRYPSTSRADDRLVHLRSGLVKEKIQSCQASLEMSPLVSLVFLCFFGLSVPNFFPQVAHSPFQTSERMARQLCRLCDLPEFQISLPADIIG